MHALRFAFRQLLKSPGFSGIAILTLALGIGLNTSMFSLMDLLLLQPLPYPDRDHLVRLYRTTPQSDTADHGAGDFLEIARDCREFLDAAAYRPWSFTLTPEDRPPVNLNSLRVSGNFFAALGLRPQLGRFITPADDQPGNHVVVLSHATWLAQFGGDPAIVGRNVRIDGEPTTVIGVMPVEFSSVFLWGPADAIRPLALTPAEKIDRNDSAMRILGRIPTHLTLAQVNARLQPMAERLAQHRSAQNRQDGLRAVSLQSTIRNPGSVGISSMLLGLAGFVLLIACANLANLQLARAVARGHEFAIRSALGASRARLLVPLLSESMLLALVGGGLGLLVSVWANDWISSRLSANGVVTFTLQLDGRVLGFAIGLSALTGLAFGLVPAWLMSRVQVNDALKSGGRSNTGDRRQHRFRHALIIAQFALALVLLASAGLFLGGLKRLLARETGWNQHGLVQGVVSLPTTRYRNLEQTCAFYRQVQERLNALPGVERSAVGWVVPIFQFLSQRPFVVEGQDLPPTGREPVADLNAATPGYFATLGVNLLAGRDIAATDTLASRRVVLVNRSLAEALFPHENPIGRRLGGTDAAHRDWAEIIGVFPDLLPAVGVGQQLARYQMFKPLAQEPWGYVTIVLRGQSPAALVEPMRRAVAEVDPDLAVQQLGTVDDLVRIGLGAFATINTILTVFALLGLFLAALGLYGVIARLVIQRTPEIGVRVALGAQAGDVVWLILRAGVKLTLIGTALGLVGAFGLSFLLGSFIPGIPLQDPLTIVGMAGLLGVIAVLACWLPARRATRVDPIAALRAE
jgi:predicted permease